MAIKRWARAGATPVILLHGIAVNADVWDLPDVVTDEYHYRSLATVLYEAGFDIWLVNLRGHGGPNMRSEPPAGQDDWCVDHFIHYDLPAVVDHVTAGGRRAFLVGASMGAITLAGYLQGAVLGERRNGGMQVVVDADVAMERQRRLCGAIFAEFPAVLRWPESLYDAQGRVRWRFLLREWRQAAGATNLPFEVLSHWAWLHALLDVAGQVPVQWFMPEPGRKPWYRNLPEGWGGRVAELERQVWQAMLRCSGTFTGATHHRAEVMLQGRRYVFDHMKAGVLRQLAECVRRRAIVSALGEPAHVYSDHYVRIALPTLVVQGGRDRIAHPEFTRTAFFERIAAQDREFLLFEPIAHGEIEAAPYATEQIYPRIREWMGGRKGD